MHQGGGEKWNEIGTKVFQFPNPRNLGHRVEMGASEEIGSWYLLEAASRGDFGGENHSQDSPGSKGREPSGTGLFLGVSQPRSGDQNESQLVALSWSFNSFSQPLPLHLSPLPYCHLKVTALTLFHIFQPTESLGAVKLASVLSGDPRHPERKGLRP